ncbi:MAG TPA: fibronectin type III domain-containing protein [Terriglobia bacterium]|jgi:hypothetical protein
MDGNAALGTPPVPIANLKTSMDTFAVSMAAAANGGKEAVADKNKDRQDLMLLMRLLAHHVEGACKGDISVFLSSGFQPATNAKTPPVPLTVPVLIVDQGQTGELLATVKSVPNALHYDLSKATVSLVNGQPTIPAPTPGMMLTSVRKPVVFDQLTPGTTYVFQVRAFGKPGLTEWCAPVQKMCT